MTTVHDELAALGDTDAQGLPVIHHFQPKREWLAKETPEAIIDPELKIVDPHHHLWERAGGYLLDDLLADTMDGHRVVATVYAQCGYHYRSEGPPELAPVGETEFCAEVGEEADRRGDVTRACLGIVGYADMELGDDVARVLEAHVEAGRGRFRGVRHINARHEAFNASLLGRPPIDLFDRDGFRRGLKQLHRAGLSFDAWHYHHQIDDLVRLAQALPELPIVLNHVGGPLGVGPYAGRKDLAFSEWKPAMQRLAACPNVSVKLGGLAMAISGVDWHTKPAPPSSEQLAEAWKGYLLTSIELFGADRCMLESNFPVDKAMCTYRSMWNAFKRVTSGASANEKAALFGGTANRFYRLGLDLS